MKKMSLVVLNYNGIKLLKEYFDSLFSQTLLPDEIFLVDNNSNDDSVQFVTKNYPQVTVIKNSRNFGTAEGSNIGFKHTTGDYIVFQSNDIVLHKDCIKRLVEFLDANPKTGVCTSVLLKKNTTQIDNTGGIVDVFGFPMQKYPNIDISLIPESGEVFFSYGGSFIVRSSLFKKIKGFDSRYFTLNDDVDLCWRARLMGYFVCYTKNSRVYHKGSATLGNLFSRARKHYWSERNLLRTFIKNQKTKNLLLLLPLYLLLLFAEMVYMLYRLKFNLFFYDLKAIMWNLLYLPETIYLRLKIQKSKKKNVEMAMFQKTSFKLKLFKGFKTAI